MELNYERKALESDLQYLLRLVEIKMEMNPDDLGWKDIVDMTKLDVHPETLRKAMQPKEFGGLAIYKEFKTMTTTDDEHREKLREIQREIQKLRDENLSIRENNRLASRKENILEQVRDYVKIAEPIKVPEPKFFGRATTTFIGGIADAHFGKDLVIKDLFGNDMNVYNEEIFHNRMWELLDHYIDIITDEDINKIAFFDLGDSIEGILRNSALQTIKYGIVESTVRYAKFMGEWLNELSKYVKVDYYDCLGNHSEIRILNAKQGDFPKENMQYVVNELISAYLINNDRVTVNPTTTIQYVDFNGVKILATHGQNESNLISSVKDYKEMYDVKVDIMLSGHLHNSKQETASLNTKVIQFPSIVGIDDFSMKIKRSAKAEGKVILIKGKRLMNIDINLQ